MKRNLCFKGGILLAAALILSSSLIPSPTFAAEVGDGQEIIYNQDQSEESDIKEQFSLTEDYLNSIDKSQVFELNSNQ